MAELLPLLPWALPGAQDGAQDSPIPPAEPQAQGDGAQGLAREPWRYLEVPTICITPPSSDGGSPPCTPKALRLQSLRTPDLESLFQDRSGPGGGMGERVSVLASLGTCVQGWVPCGYRGGRGCRSVRPQPHRGLTTSHEVVAQTNPRSVHCDSQLWAQLSTPAILARNPL
jgi:hypothetical protein